MVNFSSIVHLAFYLLLGLITICVIRFILVQILKSSIMMTVIWVFIFMALGISMIVMRNYIAGAIAIVFAFLPPWWLE